MRAALISTLLLGACGGQGTWVLTTWGEAYIESGIPSTDFQDGCEATFDEFLVVYTERALIDGDGEVAGEIEGAQVYDLVQAGPTEMGRVEVKDGLYDAVRLRIAPSSAATAGNATEAQVDAMIAAGASVKVRGSLTCGILAATFDWSFNSDTTYACEPESLTVPAGGEVSSQSTIHGDHFFYDALEDPDANVRGTPLLGADGHRGVPDGAITFAELDSLPIANTGYDVGSHAEVETMADYLTVLTSSLGHIDGEGHCGTP